MRVIVFSQNYKVMVLEEVHVPIFISTSIAPFPRNTLEKSDLYS